MKELEELTDIEKAVLLACCNANKFSLSSHVPKEAIMRGLRNLPPKYRKKGFNVLLTNGFIIKKPTGGQKTYRLSTKGLKAGNRLKEDF